MIIAALLIGGLLYLAHLLPAGPPGSGPTPAQAKLRPQHHFDGSTSDSAHWTALDEHQLNRLLDEFSP